MSDNYRDDMEMRAYGPSRHRKTSAAEIGALVFAVVWVLICIVFFFGLGGTEAGTEKNGVGFVLVVASVLVPIAVVWLAVASARSARIMTDESDRLQASMSAMRKVLIEVQEFQALNPPRPEERTSRIEAGETPRIGSDETPTFTSSRPHGAAGGTTGRAAEAEKPGPDPETMRNVSPEPETEAAAPPKEKAPEDDQPDLGLDAEADTSPQVDIDDLIRAINFPENADDEAGFEALRRTLVDRKVATLIQAAQDVLTLLSQDGIYMDDLEPLPAPAKTWRAFAGGARGQDVAALAGVNDRSSLALSSGRMKSDDVFRDAALHFLRQYDAVLVAAEPRMSDAQIDRFATTRSSRAFMLLGRITGAFDAS